MDQHETGRPKRRVKVDLVDLELAFDSGSDETTHYLNLETGRVIGINQDFREELDQIDALMDAGGSEPPVDERRLTRARRAVEKAAAILAEPDDAGG